MTHFNVESLKKRDVLVRVSLQPSAAELFAKNSSFFDFFLKMRTFQWPNFMKFCLALDILQTNKSPEFRVSSSLFVEVIHL